MGLFSSRSAVDDDDMISIWGGLGETGKPGKHRGGNMHGSAKKVSTGKHGKLAKGGKPVPKGKK